MGVDVCVCPKGINNIDKQLNKFFMFEQCIDEGNEHVIKAIVEQCAVLREKLWRLNRIYNHWKSFVVNILIFNTYKI